MQFTSEGRLAELAQIRAMHSSWKSIGRILLSSLLASAAILFWVGVAGGPGSARWVLLVLAVACTGLFARIFGQIEFRGVRGSRRYLQLDRLSKEWQAKTERGEIPQTTPGG